MPSQPQKSICCIDRIQWRAESAPGSQGKGAVNADIKLNYILDKQVLKEQYFLKLKDQRMLDEISLKILKILQKKARIPNVEVARQVDMAPSAVLERIRKLEKKGFIDGYEVRLNPEKFKRNLVAFITITTRSQESVTVTGKRLTAIPEIQEVHHIAGEDGFLVKARVSDVAELGKLIHDKILKIEGVKKTRSAIAMSTFKETARIPIDTHDLV